ncbi:hypothetical protein AB6A40_002276 [Gnathostoma spinigerum]|uniref:Uncharacterized protein n=1 Tax=Gnathostoma spinigerum TaxID=75299 RepID=A0ABD6E8E1_9BILA
MKPNIPTIKTTHPEMRIELLESAIKTMEQRCIELMKSNESLSVSNAQLSIQNDHLSVKLDQLQRQRSISSQSSMGTSKVRKSSVGSGDERINFNKVSNGNVCSKMLTVNAY